MGAASVNEVKYEVVCKKLTKSPVCNMIGEIPAIMNNLPKELLSVIDWSNLEMTQLSFSFSTKIGICQAMTSDKATLVMMRDMGAMVSLVTLAEVENPEGEEESAGKRKEMMLQPVVMDPIQILIKYQ